MPGMIVAPQPEAVEVGAKVLAEGGNAFDAALAGSNVSADMWEKHVIGPNPGGWGLFLKDRINEDGYLSICIPGAVRGLEAIHSRWCTKSWKELIEPAAELAGGHILGRYGGKHDDGGGGEAISY